MIPLVNAVFGTTFLPVANEKRFKDYEADEAKRAELLDELEGIVERLRAEEAERRIDDSDRSVLHTSLTTVLRGLSRKYGKILRGVENTMKGEILEYEAKRIRNTGKAEGRSEMLFDLVGKGRLTDLEASEEIKMPIADLQRRMAEYDRAHA